MTTNNTTPTNYVVRAEYREAWGSPAPGTVIGMDEIRALASEWGKSVDELLDQVEPSDAPAIFVADDDGTSVDLKARTIEGAREEARREWESATPGTYTVGIYKYDSDGTPEIVETITVVARLPMTPCTHPPRSLYCWFARHCGRTIRCIACTACGAVLEGGAE